MSDSGHQTRLAELLADFGPAWELCGDLSVAIARGDQALLWRYLTDRGWWLELAENGQVRVLGEGVFIDTPGMKVWASKQAHDPSFIEIVLDD